MSTAGEVVQRLQQVGARVQCTHHEWYGDDYPSSGALMEIREVTSANGDRVRFSDGGSLTLGPMEKFRATERGFEVDLLRDGKFSETIRYEWR